MLSDSSSRLALYHTPAAFVSFPSYLLSFDSTDFASRLVCSSIIPVLLAARGYSLAFWPTFVFTTSIENWHTPVSDTAGIGHYHD